MKLIFSILFILILISTTSAFDVSEFDFTYTTPINYSTIATVNSSDFWDALDTPGDISTGDLTDDDTYVEVAGDTMTGNLEINDAGDDTSIILHGGDTNLNASIIFQEVTLDRWRLLFEGLSNNFYLWNDFTDSPTWMANLVNNAMTFYGNTTIFGNLLPGASLTYDIGSPTNRWLWGYFANISSDYGDFLYDVNIDGDLQVDGIMNVTNMTIKNMWIVNMIATGNISTDANFVGDGSYLTGIESGIWTNVSNTATFEGNANVTGNVTIGTGLIWHNGTHLILRG